jgi:hypothetical protein
MQRVPIALHDVLCFRHAFLEVGIVGRKLLGAIRAAQTADHLPGQYDSKRIPELRLYFTVNEGWVPHSSLLLA